MVTKYFEIFQKATQQRFFLPQDGFAMYSRLAWNSLPREVGHGMTAVNTEHVTLFLEVKDKEDAKKKDK